MNDIEVGEYVRTKTGRIFKITAYDETQNKYHSVIEHVWNIIFPRDIIKHSKNIIDLIEVGDYVNGWKVLSIVTTLDKPEEIGFKFLGFDNLLFDINIKSIVTKEQFKQIEYIVEE